MTTPLIWAILILCLGLMLLVAELFIPSGGILGILAGCALAGSVLLAFTQSVTAGLFFILIVLISLPTIVLFGMQMWPRTPIGRRMLLETPTAEEVDPASDTVRELYSLIGQVGRTTTQLRPAGMTEIDGRRVDTIAEGIIIEPGKLVRVIDVRGHRVVVRQLEEGETPA